MFKPHGHFRRGTQIWFSVSWRLANVQGRASFVHVWGNFWISDLFNLGTDNFTARDPWTWRWKEDTRVIPYARKVIFWQGLRAGQLGAQLQYQVVLQCATVCCSEPQCVTICCRGWAALSNSDTQGITLVSPLQRHVHGSIVMKLSMSTGKNRKPKKIY